MAVRRFKPAYPVALNSPAACSDEYEQYQQKEHIYHAAMMEPHPVAELSLDDIRKMVDELLDAHAQWLPLTGKAAAQILRSPSSSSRLKLP